MSYDREFELSLQKKRLNDNYIQNGPPPKRNKKKSKSKTIAIIILSILGSAALGFGIYVFVSWLNNKDDKETSRLLAPNTPLANVKNSNNVLINSTYSISLKYSDGLSLYASYGTAWSYGFNENSWYLLTNFHVVRDYLYYNNAHHFFNVITSPYNINQLNTFDLKKYNGSNQLSSIMGNFDSNKNDSINEYSVNIITDNNDSSINLFSEGNISSSNFYSLDMAMIEIKDLSGNDQIKSYIENNKINLPFNDWLNNKSYLFIICISNSEMNMNFLTKKPSNFP